MRVLTFNSHQSYLHLLATALPWTFGVVTPRLPSGRVLRWDPAVRPRPLNVQLFDSIDSAEMAGHWDWVLLHNAHDLIDSGRLPHPKVFLVHGTLSGRLLQDGASVGRGEYLERLQVLLTRNNCRVVYISDLKREDWAIPGVVIRHGINVDQYGQYRGDGRAVLHVANHLRERGAILGWEAYRAACQGLPAVLIGRNPDIPWSRCASSWDDLKDEYRRCRLYLFTAAHPFEDGYNLSLLEAMATGMPVATIRHPSSPVRDGIEGVVAADARTLREQVLSLLDRPGDAFKMGLAARARAEREFPISVFRESWEALAQRL